MPSLTRRDRRVLLGGAILAAALFRGAPANADEPVPTDAATRAQHVEKLNDDGAAAYHARDYRRANEKFQQAYALDPDPNILYNIAKTYELLGDDAAALEKFEQFVNQPGGDPQGRSKAQAKISEIRARMAGGRRASPSTPAGAEAPPPEQTLVVPTIISLGIGVAGIAVGSIYGVVALGKRSDLDKVCLNKACPNTSQSDISSLKTSSTVSTIGFVAGGVGLAAAILFYIGGRPSEPVRVGAVKLGPSAGGIGGSF